MSPRNVEPGLAGADELGEELPLAECEVSTDRAWVGQFHCGCHGVWFRAERRPDLCPVGEAIVALERSMRGPLDALKAAHDDAVEALATIAGVNSYALGETFPRARRPDNRFSATIDEVSALLADRDGEVKHSRKLTAWLSAIMGALTDSSTIKVGDVDTLADGVRELIAERNTWRELARTAKAEGRKTDTDG